MIWCLIALPYFCLKFSRFVQVCHYAIIIIFIIYFEIVNTIIVSPYACTWGILWLHYTLSRFMLQIELVYVTDWPGLCYRLSRFMLQIEPVYVTDWPGLCYRLTRFMLQIDPVYVTDWPGLCYRLTRFMLQIEPVVGEGAICVWWGICVCSAYVMASHLEEVSSMWCSCHDITHLWNHCTCKAQYFFYLVLVYL